MGERFAVDTAEIDTASRTVAGIASFAASRAPHVGAIAVHPEFLASVMLSPRSGWAAEVALVDAGAHVAALAVQAEALAASAMALARAYAAAEASLMRVAQGLGAAGHVALDAIGSEAAAGFVPVALLLACAEGIRSGVAGALAGTVIAALARAAEQVARNPSTWSEAVVDAGSSISAGVSALGPREVAAERALLRDMRVSGGYQLLLGVLVADGNALGYFRDGRASLVDEPIGGRAARSRKARAVTSAEAETGIRVAVNADGDVVPRDVSSLLVGADQIDRVGGDSFANIRILRVTGRDGVVRFTVQIPSTQNWSPVAGATPNDLTSDAVVMRSGGVTALSVAVFAAMRAAGITDEPVMLTGFSLGGITAAAMAAQPRGFNVRQVVTAGAPIGQIHIRRGTAVTSLAATSDPVAALDGVRETSRPGWRVVTDSAPRKRSEPGVSVSALRAHDAQRYALMAAEHPEVNDDPAIALFLAGRGKDATVSDFAATRVP